ncbi:hypothetical protein DRN86_04875, partial [Candidatus Geothermarchaeota archaeon]
MPDERFHLITPLKPFEGKLVDKYLVVKNWSINGNQYSFISEVSIVEKEGRIYYNILEPYSEFREKVEEILTLSKFWLKPEREYMNDPVGYFMNEVIRRYEPSGGLSEDLIKSVKYYLIREILGYGPLTTPINDPNVEDISCAGVNRHVKIWHKNRNRLGWLTANLKFNEEELDELVAKLVYRANKSVSVMNPIAEGVLPEGYRINASWKTEISDFGSSFTIRKFREKPYTITELISMGTLDSWTASYLWLMMEFKGFILIMGASGSGKTTLLNAISMLVNPNAKIISIEDVREIFLLHDGWKPLKTRIRENPVEEGEDIDLFDLVKFALRERMDFLILGESRGREARLLFQGAATGHGAITTFHSSSIEALLARLKNDPISIGDSMLRLLDVVIHIIIVNRGGRVERKVKSVYENSNNGWREVISWNKGNSWNHDENMNRLFEKARNYGLSKSDVIKELNRRRKFLE